MVNGKKSAKAIKISELLTAAISSGKYAPGSYLPPERLLAAELQVSRGTFRKALEILRQTGTIRINPGRGVRVTGGSDKCRPLRFVVCRPDNFDFFSAGESMLFLKGICTGAAACHIEILLSFFSSANPEAEIEKLIASYTSESIDGIIYYDCHSYEKFILPLEKAAVPYVVGNLEVDIPAVSVKMDFRAIGREAGRYLLRNGHRDIGILGGSQEHFMYREIIAGFRGALAEEEIPISPENIFACCTDSSAAEKICSEILASKKRPTALFTIRDIRAAGCYAACRELGLSIPDDLSIISYDGLSWPEAGQHGLTLIEQPAETIGRRAVDLLKEWNHNGMHPESQIIPGVFRPGHSVKSRK